jgi:F-type H+-transporting ATPase subunit a
MEITPDIFIYWQWHGLKINATIAITWMNMALLVLGAWLVTRKLGDAGGLSRWQNLMEVLVSGMEEQIHDMGLAPPREFLPFLGSLFLFVLFSNILSVIPVYVAPTGSLSTTTALAICVFLSVPMWGIQRRGLVGYLRLYIKPSVFMLPFNVMGELSRTLALAVRLFGNVMSGSMIAGILLSIAPFFFPVLMQLLGLITGVIQAYIFAVLAAVYIAAAAQMEKQREEKAKA